MAFNKVAFNEKAFIRVVFNRVASNEIVFSKMAFYKIFLLCFLLIGAFLEVLASDRIVKKDEIGRLTFRKGHFTKGESNFLRNTFVLNRQRH